MSFVNCDNCFKILLFITIKILIKIIDIIIKFIVTIFTKLCGICELRLLFWLFVCIS